jgi:hypothetical protein
MWADIAKHLATFDTAVLTAHDAAGYPFSVRCRPQVDNSNQLLRLSLAADLPLQPGPAGLLCHFHDEQMWNLRSFVVRGRLEREGEGWLFRPVQFIPGAGIGGFMGQMRFLRKARQMATAYLQKRGLARPPIPWDEVKALHEQAKKEEQTLEVTPG